MQSSLELTNGQTRGRRRLADVVAEQLALWGVTRVYGVAGDTILPLIDAFSRQPSIRFVPVRHEETAALMASAEAKLTGKIAVCLATSGPGAASLVNGLADAYIDKAPVLALTGQVETYNIGTGYVQDIDQQLLFKAVTGYSAQLGHEQAIIKLLTRAMKTAVTQGTVAHVGIPKDLWLRETIVQPAPLAPSLHTHPRPDPDVIHKAASVLSEAKRPVFLIGSGAKKAIQPLLDLAERVSAGIIFSMNVIGRIPGEHPLVIGGLGEAGAEEATELLQQADFVLRAGTNWWPTEFVPDNIYTLDLDLHPIQVGNGEAPSFGAVGEAELIVPQLLDEVFATAKPQWEETILAKRKEWRERLSREQAQEGSPIPPPRIMRSFQETVPIDALIALDVGDHVLWFNRSFIGSGRQDLLISGTWRTMGFGLAAVMAAKFVDPSRPAVAIVGDGGISRLMGDFLTAVRERLSIVVLIFNNGTLAMEKNQQRISGLATSGTELNNPDFAAFAQSCGGIGLKVTQPAELDGALRQAFSVTEPVLVDILTADTPVPTADIRAAAYAEMR